MLFQSLLHFLPMNFHLMFQNANEISTETGNIDLEVLLRWDLDDYKSEEVNAEMINQLIKQLKTNDFPQERQLERFVVIPFGFLIPL